MNLQKGLEDFQADFTRNHLGSPEVSEMEQKDLKWATFCQNENIEEMYYNVNFLKDVACMHAIGREQIYQWLITQNLNLIFYGGPGSGKTHLALGIIRYFYEKKRHVRYIHDCEILEKGKKSGIEYLNQVYGESDVLMIDDFGLSSIPEWEIKNYLCLLNKRFPSRRPTIITTNLNQTELETRYNKSTLSRLPAVWVRFEDVDRRVFGF